VAVGAPFAGSVGAAYLYTQAGEGWAAVGKLTPELSGAGEGDTVGDLAVSYGRSVSLKDWVLAVGAPGARGDGAAYVYSWAPAKGAWELWAELTSGEATLDHEFGHSVALNDAFAGPELAVGAPGKWDMAGAVYLFDTLSDVWSMYDKVTEPVVRAAQPAVGTPIVENEFGEAVSLKGDVLAVGAPAPRVVMPQAGGADDTAGFSIMGAVYIYHRQDGVWPHVDTLTPADPEAYDGFGASVAVAGDLTLFVGSPGRDVDDDLRQGVVYAYDWTGMIYQDPYQLVESAGGSDDWLGTSLAVSEGQVLAGAPGTTVGGNIGQGSASLFTLPRPLAKVAGASARWQRTSAHLTFTGVEAEGGAAVDYTQYRIGNGEWKTGAMVTIKRQGATRVQYRAVDVFGTLGATRSVTVRIDSRRPRVVAKPSTAQAGTIVRLRFKVADPRPSSGAATVRVVVQNAAGQKVTKSAARPIATNVWRTVRVKALRLSPGTYWVFLHAVDRAGNQQDGPTPTRLIVR
jgi:hypothetical protein